MRPDGKSTPPARFPRSAWPMIVAAVATLAMAWPAAAQSPRDVRLLTPREEQRLNAEARELYKKGVQALDRINPATAIEIFDAAAQLAPESMELQFLTARLAQLRARRVLDAEAEKYYQVAERALERLGQRKNLTPLEQRRVDMQTKEIKDERQKLEIRKQRRFATGAEFRKMYAKERYPEDDPEKKEAEKIQRAKNARKQALKNQMAPATGRPPMPGVAPGVPPMAPPPAYPGGPRPGGSQYDS